MNRKYSVYDLHTASAQTDLKQLREILCSDPELLNHPDCTDVRRLLLFKITFDHNEKILELLLNYPKRIIYGDEDNLNKHLSSAINRGNRELTEFLLKNGASFEGEEWQADRLASRLFSRINMGTRKDILKVLVQYGLDMSVKSPGGRNLLHQFVSEYVKELDEDAASIVEILLVCGIPVDEVDNNGYSPLILAIYEQNIELIKFLISEGADLNRRSTDRGVLPLTLAVRVDNASIVELLLSKGAKIDSTDFDGWTALHTACTHNRERMIELLVRQGANVAAEDATGRTPFFYLNQKMENFSDCSHIMVKEISQKVFDETPFSKKDLKLMLEIPVVQEQLKSCIDEVEHMSGIQFYRSYSYYSVLKMDKNVKEFALLLKNEDFMKSFIANMLTFKNYETDFRRILKEGFLIKDKLDVVDSKVYSTYGDVFSSAVIKNFPQYLAEDDLIHN